VLSHKEAVTFHIVWETEREGDKITTETIGKKSH